MMSRTHLAFGFLIGLLSLNYFNIPNVYVYLAILCVGSILADIDNSESRIGKRIKVVSWPIEKIFGHRNFFHSIFPLVIIFVLFFYIIKWNVVGAALLIGYGSHIFIDMFTHMGVALFHPFHNKRITGFMKTGGVAEHALFFSIVLVDLILLSTFI